MMQDYYFNEEHNHFRESLRKFLDREVMPYVDDWEEARRTPKELWQKFGAQGYLGINFPEAYGGMDSDFFFSVVFVEEMSRCFSGGIAIAPIVQQYMSTPYILNAGSDELKQRLLPDAIAGKTLFSIAISEPGAGSDVANIQTRAVRDGEHYVVNGSKTFITNGYYGDYLVTVVKTDPDAGVGGISLLVIDRNADGVSANKLKKLGWHASDTAELFFDDVRVPVENLVGEEGMGFRYLMGGLQLERLVGAVSAVAGASHAVEYSLKYMRDREAFGRPLTKFQVLRHRLADLLTKIEANRAFVHHLCQVHADGNYAVKECSMAKLKATELSDEVMYKCLQFFGGYGFMEEYKIARMFRDSRVLTIGAGTSEVMREIIAKMMIDDKSYASAFKHKKSAPKRATEIKAKDTVTLAQITERIKNKTAAGKPFGATIKFAFPEGTIFVDGTGETTVVNNNDEGAQCTISMSLADFAAMTSGGLDPMAAFMGGKLSVDGDMNVAMQLSSLLG